MVLTLFSVLNFTEAGTMTYMFLLGSSDEQLNGTAAGLIEART